MREEAEREQTEVKKKRKRGEERGVRDRGKRVMASVVRESDTIALHRS